MREILLEYCAYVSLMTIIGSCLGLFFQQYMLEKTGRPSYSVFVFTLCIMMVVVSTVGLNIPIVIQQSDNGTLWQTGDYCKRD